MPQQDEQVLELRIRYMVLLLLTVKPMHGYEIIKRLREILGRVGGSPSPGTVYPVLHKLVAEGLIEQVGEPAARQAKTYRVTRRGLQHLLGMASTAFELLASFIQLHSSLVEAARREGLSSELGKLVESIARLRKAVEELEAKARG